VRRVLALLTLEIDSLIVSDFQTFKHRSYVRDFYWYLDCHTFDAEMEYSGIFWNILTMLMTHVIVGSHLELGQPQQLHPHKLMEQLHL